MSIVPSTYDGSITFFENRLPGWETNYAEIGLLVGDVGALETLTTAARAALTAQELAQNAAKAATQNMHLAVSAMRALGAINIQKIKTYADATNNPGVFPIAELPDPATPTALGPPGLCTNLSVTLQPGGALVLKWKCVNPVGATGTSYEVARSVGGAPFTIIGSGGGNKTFIDDTLLSSSSPVTYRITGIRSSVRGTSNEFVVKFGMSGGGGFAVQSVNEVTPVQLAA